MTNEKDIINILGSVLFEQCVAFFQEVFERKCSYKIIMTRRCFSLYKIFYPILKQMGLQNKYGEIITDKAIPLYKDKIIKALEEENTDSISVLIVDDIIIFGRTINTLLDEFLDVPLVEKEQRLNHILVQCIMQNKHHTNVHENYGQVINPMTYGSRRDWKVLSSKFSKLIKVSGIANTSYVVSYRNSVDDCEMRKFFAEHKKSFIENTNTESKNNQIISYVLNATCRSDNNNIYKFIECNWIRMHYYEKQNALVVSPLVVFKELDEKNMNILCSNIADLLSQEKSSAFLDLLNSSDQTLYSVKARLAILLVSHNLLCNFLNTYKDFFDRSVGFFDSEEILDYNFIIGLDKCFESLTSQFKTNSLFDFNCVIDEIYNPTEDIELFLFQKAMLDNKAAFLGAFHRLDGFSCLKNNSVFSNSVMPQVLSFIDNGRAALKSFYLDGKFESLLYPGEQAFRIMEDKFLKYLPCLHYLERYSKVNNLNSYDIYDDFVDYLLETVTDKNELDKETLLSLKNYIGILKETDQEISDVYSHLCYCSNEDDIIKCDDGIMKDFFEKRKS